MPLRPFTLKISTLNTSHEVNDFEKLYGKVESYFSTSYELAKLKSLEVAVLVASSFISTLSVVVMLFLFILVSSIGIALWLGDLLGEAYCGFFIVSFFYLLLGLVFSFFLRRWISKPVSKLIITEALS